MRVDQPKPKIVSLKVVNPNDAEFCAENSRVHRIPLFDKGVNATLGLELSFLTRALGEYFQKSDDGHEGQQQPNPLQNRSPVPRRNIFPPAELGGSRHHEAAFPPFDAANRNSKLLADRFHGFAPKQAQNGRCLFVTRETRISMVRGF
jgi:hypothetical protein